MIRPVVGALALLLAAAAPVPVTPPVPAVLAPYVLDGHFEPGDYRWMRGAFADATPADRAAWQTVVDWRTRCMKEGDAATVAALAERGVAVTQPLHVTGDGLCGEVGYAAPGQSDRSSWPSFEAALLRARPIATAITWSAAIAQLASNPTKSDPAAELMTRPITDQVLRQAVLWKDIDVPGAPVLDRAAQGAADGLLWLAIARRDHANTVWLKALVAAHGWPTKSSVGADASHKAWLLVQHADDDPVFQYDSLRRMEPLVAKGEVAKPDYAYLYDRVMLKLTGKQRYASQFACQGGKLAPLPLEDAAGIERLRRDMGMDPLATYAAQMADGAAPCPADVIPPSPAKR